MTLWFAASAVVPVLQTEHAIAEWQAAALSSSVALGFVAGTLLSAVFGLADRLEPRAFFATAALVGAAANAAAVLLDPASMSFIALRLIVGTTIAGIYPVGIKMATSWAADDMGLLVGLLVGALTLGSASSFLLAAFGGLDWRAVILGASVLAAAAAGLILLFREGPRARPTAVFRTAYVLDTWRVRPLRLANFGYYGHMWELYAFWAWIAAFLQASFQTTAGGEAPFWAKLAAFAVIGFGVVGSLAGGLLADRWGRTTLTIGAMLLSGGCCLLSGFLFGAPPWLLTLFCIFWGIVVIADSAQFSASVVELSPPERAGTMVTMQTCVGFLLTMVSIHLVPMVAETVGWRWTFAFLSVGPFLGAGAMMALRRDPAAAKLAGGRG